MVNVRRGDVVLCDLNPVSSAARTCTQIQIHGIF